GGLFVTLFGLPHGPGVGCPFGAAPLDPLSGLLGSLTGTKVLALDKGADPPGAVVVPAVAACDPGHVLHPARAPPATLKKPASPCQAQTGQKNFLTGRARRPGDSVEGKTTSGSAFPSGGAALRGAPKPGAAYGRGGIALTPTTPPLSIGSG